MKFTKQWLCSWWKQIKSNNPCILSWKTDHYVSSYAFKNICLQLSDMRVKTDHKHKNETITNFDNCYKRRKEAEQHKMGYFRQKGQRRPTELSLQQGVICNKNSTMQRRINEWVLERGLMGTKALKTMCGSAFYKEIFKSSGFQGGREEKREWSKNELLELILRVSKSQIITVLLGKRKEFRLLNIVINFWMNLSWGNDMLWPPFIQKHSGFWMENGQEKDPK